MNKLLYIIKILLVLLLNLVYNNSNAQYYNNLYDIVDAANGGKIWSSAGAGFDYQNGKSVIMTTDRSQGQQPDGLSFLCLGQFGNVCYNKHLSLLNNQTNFNFYFSAFYPVSPTRYIVAARSTSEAILCLIDITTNSIVWSKKIASPCYLQNFQNIKIIKKGNSNSEFIFMSTNTSPVRNHSGAISLVTFDINGSNFANRIIDIPGIGEYELICPNSIIFKVTIPSYT